MYLARLPDGADQARIYPIDVELDLPKAWRFDALHGSEAGGRRYRGVAAIDTTAEGARRMAWNRRDYERKFGSLR